MWLNFKRYIFNFVRIFTKVKKIWYRKYLQEFSHLFTLKSLNPTAKRTTKWLFFMSQQDFSSFLTITYNAIILKSSDNIFVFLSAPWLKFSSRAHANYFWVKITIGLPLWRSLLPYNQTCRNDCKISWDQQFQNNHSRKRGTNLWSRFNIVNKIRNQTENQTSIQNSNNYRYSSKMSEKHFAFAEKKIMG